MGLPEAYEGVDHGRLRLCLSVAAGVLFAEPVVDGLRNRSNNVRQEVQDTHRLQTPDPVLLSSPLFFIPIGTSS